MFAVEVRELELYRLLVSQISDRYSTKATSSKENAEILDKLLEGSKPQNKFSEWDILIATPFRYPLPVNPIYQARFRPPNFSRNVMYGCEEKLTSAYECSYHFLKQRIHLQKLQETGYRTLFVVKANTEKTIDLRNRPDIHQIMNRNDYSYSYKVANDHSDSDGFLYPSCRSPESGLCAAIYQIQCLDKDVKREWNIPFDYNYKNKSVTWMRTKVLELSIKWNQVS